MLGSALTTTQLRERLDLPAQLLRLEPSDRLKGEIMRLTGESVWTNAWSERPVILVQSGKSCLDVRGSLVLLKTLHDSCYPPDR